MADLEITFERVFEETDADCSMCDLCNDIMIGKMHHCMIQVAGNPFSVFDCDFVICQSCMDVYNEIN